jgi:hypothetical protein
MAAALSLKRAILLTKALDYPLGWLGFRFLQLAPAWVTKEPFDRQAKVRELAMAFTMPEIETCFSVSPDP